MIGLYVHLPFCVHKCHYCDFAITTDRSLPMRERFFEALRLETGHAASRWGRLRFDTLYLGGGTPSELAPGEMTHLMNLMRQHFDFAADAEITCEMNPGDAPAGKLAALRDLWINRISLGAQAFQDKHLHASGRVHTVNDILQTYESLRAFGFRNINLDLIARLPGQTLEEFEESLERTVTLAPEQVTVYDLDVKEKTVFGMLHERGQLKLADEETHALMARSCERILKNAGYRQYELCTYARPGFESRHNLVYWKGGRYLALGPGAVSYMEGARFQLAPDVAGYLDKCRRADWTPSFHEALTPEKKEIEMLITLLRLDEGIDLKGFRVIREPLEAELSAYRGEGLLEAAGSRYTFTERGRRVAEAVLAGLVQELSSGG